MTDRAAARTLSLPMYPSLTEAEQDDGHRRGPRPRSRTPRRDRRASPPDDGRLVAGGGSATLRVGLIGLGSMGRNHLRILGRREGARLAAVADPDRDRARRRRRRDRRARASPSRSR